MSLYGQQKIISLYKNDTQFGSFKFSEATAEKEKAFRDGEIILNNTLMSGSLLVSKLHFNLNNVHVL